MTVSLEWGKRNCYSIGFDEGKRYGRSARKSPAEHRQFVIEGVASCIRVMSEWFPHSTTDQMKQLAFNYFVGYCKGAGWELRKDAEPENAEPMPLLIA